MQINKFFFVLINLIFFIAIDSGSNGPVQKQIMYPTRIHEKAMLPGTSSRLDKYKAIDQFILEMKDAAQENSKIPFKDNSIFRIVTYNVHYWKNPHDNKTTILEMLEIIKNLNPDIVILQEVSPIPGFGMIGHFAHSIAMKLLEEKVKVPNFAFCNTLGRGQWFGNVIASRTPFGNVEAFGFKAQLDSEENRCYIVAHTQMPNNKELNIYGTHLEVSDKTGEFREKQIKEIFDHAVTKLKNKNFLIAADFNATRESSTIQLLQKNGFRDCFSYLGWQNPTLTNWTGKEIDFIFLSPTWNLPLAGCYVYYDASSDHLPIIMDIKLD
ncbi:endonuclease/exonuclease/phosphatase family protein [Candidatus Dependentiae bacterium]|nr:endonuclease/exonuclease/phosphatase family protein [Candidatus Dependentiae bacterium]